MAEGRWKMEDGRWKRAYATSGSWLGVMRA